MLRVFSVCFSESVFSDISVFVYVFGTWAYYLVEWWHRPAVIVRLMMCDMHTVLFFCFCLFVIFHQN